MIGNALEFYDFTVYGVFADDIGKAFFPGHSPFISLMLSLATFGVGFVPRPIGALVIGRLADRVGRRAAMIPTLLADGDRHRRARRNAGLCPDRLCRTGPGGQLPG